MTCIVLFATIRLPTLFGLDGVILVLNSHMMATPIKLVTQSGGGHAPTEQPLPGEYGMTELTAIIWEILPFLTL